MNKANEKSYLAYMSHMGDMANSILPFSQSGVSLDDVDLLDSQQRRTLFNNSIFESMGEFGAKIYPNVLGAINSYKKIYGTAPDINMLAAIGAQAAWMNENFSQRAINEATTSVNAPVAPWVAAASLPLPLLTVASQLAITLPPNMTAKDKAIFYQVVMKAGKTWGNYTAGDRIDNKSLGNYTNMNRRLAVDVGDGTKTSFTANADAPVKTDSIRLMVDRRYVGEYVASAGKVVGTATIASTDYTMEASVTSANPGVVTVTSSPALPVGIEIHVQYDADVENNPDIIPSIEYDYMEMEINPHETVLTTNATVQANERFRRNIGFSPFGASESDLTNQLSADHDTHLMNSIAFFAKGPSTPIAFTKAATIANYHDIAMYQHNLLEAVETANDQLKAQTFGTAGLFAMFGSPESVRMFSLMPRDIFEPSGIRVQRANTPYYLGRYMGRYLVFCHPGMPSEKASKLVCVAKGSEWNQAGAITGIASPFQPLEVDNRAENFKLVKTVWGSRFEEVGYNIDGADYFTEIALS